MLAFLKLFVVLLIFVNCIPAGIYLLKVNKLVIDC